MLSFTDRSEHAQEATSKSTATPARPVHSGPLVVKADLSALFLAGLAMVALVTLFSPMACSAHKLTQSQELSGVSIQALGAEAGVDAKLKVLDKNAAEVLATPLTPDGDGNSTAKIKLPPATYEFQVETYDKNARVNGKGQAHAVVKSGQKTSVMIWISPYPPPETSAASPAHIQAIVVSGEHVDGNSLPPGDTATIDAQVDAPDGSPLSVAWTADGGAFSNPGELRTEWQAPQQPGDRTLTLSVTSGGTAITTAKIVLTVRDGLGTAEVTATVNTAPHVALDVLSDGTTFQLSAHVTDADGDEAHVTDWAADCDGAWLERDGDRATFQPNQSAPACIISAKAVDARAGVGIGKVTIVPGSAPPVGPVSIEAVAGPTRVLETGSAALRVDVGANAEVHARCEVAGPPGVPLGSVRDVKVAGTATGAVVTATYDAPALCPRGTYPVRVTAIITQGDDSASAREEVLAFDLVCHTDHFVTTGTNVSVASSDATVTFDHVDQVGTVTDTALQPEQVPPLPDGVQMAVLHDVSTSASHAGNTEVCWPGSPDAGAVMHLEDGAWVDRTSALSPHACALSPSLSPFAIVNPADAEISIEDPEGILTSPIDPPARTQVASAAPPVKFTNGTDLGNVAVGEYRYIIIMIRNRAPWPIGVTLGVNAPFSFGSSQTVSVTVPLLDNSKVRLYFRPSYVGDFRTDICAVWEARTDFWATPPSVLPNANGGCDGTTGFGPFSAHAVPGTRQIVNETEGSLTLGSGLRKNTKDITQCLDLPAEAADLTPAGTYGVPYEGLDTGTVRIQSDSWQRVTTAQLDIQPRRACFHIEIQRPGNFKASAHANWIFQLLEPLTSAAPAAVPSP
jgi:hypothetical protein